MLWKFSGVHMPGTKHTRDLHVQDMHSETSEF